MKYQEDTGLICIEPETECQEPAPTLEPDLVEIHQIVGS